MSGPFVHNIDPVAFEFGGVYFWWYGFSYSLGFLCVFLWFYRHRESLAMTVSEVLSITLFLCVGVLLGGRLVEVLFYEFDYYRAHPLQIPAFWLGGMATHGLLLGGTLGVLLFCQIRGRNVLRIADALAVPVAWVMGVGRLGNFIDGQISGAVTDVSWAVQFPDLDGFRHPVVLYDGLKNLLIIPLLIWISRRKRPRGVVFAHFIFWYAFLRIFIDLFREYRVETFGLDTGQMINIAMAVLGLALLIWLHRHEGAAAQVLPEEPRRSYRSSYAVWSQAAAFLALLVFCLTIPSDWTQDIPARYGERHPGMSYSWLYPHIEERVPVREPRVSDPDVAE